MFAFGRDRDIRLEGQKELLKHLIGRDLHERQPLSLLCPSF